MHGSRKYPAPRIGRLAWFVSISLLAACTLTGPEPLHIYDLTALGEASLPVQFRATSVRPDGTTIGRQVVSGRLVLYENQRFLRETWTQSTRNGKPTGGAEVDRLSGRYHLEEARIVLTHDRERTDPQTWRYDISDEGSKLQGPEPYFYNSLVTAYAVATYNQHR